MRITYGVLNAGLQVNPSPAEPNDRTADTSKDAKQLGAKSEAAKPFDRNRPATSEISSLRH